MDNAITSLMDLIIPALAAFFTDLRTWLTVAMLIGPVLLVVMGLIYFFLAPREANHKLGYRTYFGMGSVQAWQFTQKLAGLVWGGLGIGLGIAMGIVCGINSALPAEEMAGISLICLLVQVGLTLLAWLGIEITIVILFDRHGNQRR